MSADDDLKVSPAMECRILPDVIVRSAGGLTIRLAPPCMKPVNSESGRELLKGVSRSFYLTLRLLPGPMRDAASLGYLLARTSDTLADSVAAPFELRSVSLEQFGAAANGDGETPRWPAAIINATADPRERRLLECSEEILEWLRRLPASEAILVREVLAVIISGQILDLQRFREASKTCPVVLPDDAALGDYAWRVAGCVGAFWTKLGFLTMGDGFSSAPESELLDRGITYGKGLQLVNILRDLPADLATGRCYLPVADPHDLAGLMECHARWLRRAGEWVAEGEIYAKALHTRRLRGATVLPGLIARKTLKSLEGVTWEGLRSRIKIPRREVYRSLIHACFLR